MEVELTGWKYEKSDVVWFGHTRVYVMLHCPHTILETIKGWCSFHFYSLLIRFYNPFYF